MALMECPSATATSTFAHSGTLIIVIFFFQFWILDYYRRAEGKKPETNEEKTQARAWAEARARTVKAWLKSTSKEKLFQVLGV